MIKRTVLWAWSERVRIVRYLITGIGALAVDALVYLIATRLFGLHQMFANIVSVLSGATFSFLINKFWSFAEKSNTIRQTKRYAILFVGNYLFQQIGFYIMAQRLHFYDVAVKLTLVAMSVIWNFLLYKYWVYAVEV